MENAFRILALMVAAGIGLWIVQTAPIPLLSAFVQNGQQSGTDSILLSTDGGETFTSARASSRSFDVYSIVPSLRHAGIFYAGTNKGLMISDDGGTSWYTFNDLHKTLTQRAKIFAIVADAAGVYIGGQQDGSGFIYYTNDNFFTLKEIILLPDTAVRALALDNGTLVAGVADGRVFTYDASRGSFQPLASLGSAIARIYKDGAQLYVATQSSMFVRNTNGDFQKMGESIVSGIADMRIAQPSILYIASARGLLRSGNGGATWNMVQTLTPKYTAITALAIRENGSMMIGSEGQLFSTNDNGGHWNVFSPTMARKKISAIAFGENDTIIIGTQ